MNGLIDPHCKVTKQQMMPITKQTCPELQQDPGRESRQFHRVVPHWFLKLRQAPAALTKRMVFLDQNAFMSELSKLYTQNKSKGSVWITMKRVQRPINTGKQKLDLQPPFCLVHATDGKRKLACVVSAGDHLRFHMDLFTIIKANATNLQKPKRHRKNTNSPN